MKISLYTLFQLIAIAIGIGIVYLFLYGSPAYYVNRDTVFISLSLILIVVLLLYDGKRNGNAMLLILSIWLSLYVILRVLTLCYTDISLTLMMHDASVNDVNNGLIMTTLFSLVMWAGLHYNRFRYKEKSNNIHVKPTPHVGRALKFYWLSLLVWFIASREIPVVSGVASILSMYFLYQSAVFFVFTLFVLKNWEGMSSKYKLLSILSLAAFALMLTVSGSRSGFFLILRCLMFILLAMGFSKIKIKYILCLSLFTPVLIVIFMYSTYMRQTGVNIGGTLRDKMELAQRFYANTETIISKEVLSPIFTRVGYIDYTVVYVKDKEYFSEIVNISDEGKSIIDNVLSPGFDVFDMPKVSVMVGPWFSDHEKIKKSKVSVDDYSSSQLSLVGEYVILFGIPLCFLFFFLTAFAFRYIWCGALKSSTESDYVKRTYCLYFLDILLASYGLDWMALDMTCNLITVSVFFWFVTKRKSKKHRLCLESAGRVTHNAIIYT